MSIPKGRYAAFDVKRVAGRKFLILDPVSTSGGFEIYDEQMRFYGSWMFPEGFFKRVKAGEDLVMEGWK